MEEKYLNRFRSLRRSLKNLEASRTASPKEPFVLPATVQNFCLTFDLSWKVMKEIILEEYGITDFATGSPKDTLRTAFRVGLIDDDQWMQMLRVRNTLIHDYDGVAAEHYFTLMTGEFYELIRIFAEKAEPLYSGAGKPE